VEYTTFDTESELHKVAAMHPGFKLVLRIRADDPGARVPLGIKYGADVAGGALPLMLLLLPSLLLPSLLLPLLLLLLLQHGSAWCA